MLLPFFRLLSHGRLTVLVFHKVPVKAHPLEPGELDLAAFERVLRSALKLFRVLPLDEALLALRAGNLPPRAACITFDDGYPDWLPGVVPLLQRHGAHATFFVTTGQFHGLPLWNERILHAVKSLPDGASPLWLEPVLGTLAVATAPERQRTVQRLASGLKYRTPAEREAALQALETVCRHPPTQVPVMPVEHLRAIHALGFGIGGHSVSHPILSHCSEREALDEIGGARETLESLIRARVSAFAYPNGLPGRDFGPEHIALVQRAGYTTAVTTQRGAAGADTSLLQVPRFSPWGPSAQKMALQFARNLRQPSRALAEAPAPQHKRVLMVAFHFPPQAGSSGILRTLNFVKYLPGNGWLPTVLTAKARAYAEQRNDLVASIPPQTRVLRASALDAARHLSLAGKYPLSLALPDRWSSWWLGAVASGRREIRQQRPDLIWSTYPISTAHLIAATLARQSGLPWVADFRDPMVSDGHPPAGLQRHLWQSLEARVLREAAVCIFTTERAAHTYAQRYPGAAHKCRVIENGFDEEAFEGVQAQRHGVAAGSVLMLHSGLIYPFDRNPSSFFAAVAALLASGQLQRQQLCIRFRAPQHGGEVMAFATQHGLQDVVDIAPPVPYREAIAEMMGADLLLVFQGSHFNAQIPAKIYEYLRAQRPMLAVLDPAGDTAVQLQRFQGVRQAHIDQPAEVQTQLQQWLQSRNSPAQDAQLRENARLVRRYSRKAQAAMLADILDALRPVVAAQLNGSAEEKQPARRVPSD